MSYFSLSPTRAAAQMEPQLSTMELLVLRGLANGLQSKEIAVELSRSKPTVELYVRTLFTKFNAKSRAHLVAIALCEGVLGRDQIEFRLAS